MKHLIFSSILLLGTFWACTPAAEKTTGGPEAEPAAKKAPVADTPAEPTAAESELVIVARELRLDGALVWYEPDTGVMKASYTRYAFDKAEFETVVGSATPDKDITAIIQITKTEQKNTRPADPKAPSPDGGFELTIHHAKILRLK